MKLQYLRLIVIAAIAVSYGTNASAQSVAATIEPATKTTTQITATVKQSVVSAAVVKTPAIPGTKAQAAINAAGANHVFESQREAGRMQQVHNARTVIETH